MTYEPIGFKNKVVERPRTYFLQENPDGSFTLIPAPGEVYEEGTPLNAANLNKLEQGLVTHEAVEATDTQLGHVKVDGWSILSDNGVLKWAKNSAFFVTNGTFVVPPGVTTVYITGCGGGGGGRRNDPDLQTDSGGSGGGGAAVVIRIPISVSPGQNISVTVGKGGAAGTTDSRNGKAGGVTSFGSLLSIGGGGGGTSSGGGSGGSSPLTNEIFHGTDGGSGGRRTVSPTPPAPLPSSYPAIGAGGRSLLSPFFGGGGRGDGYLPGQQGAYDYLPSQPGRDGFLLIEW